MKHLLTSLLLTASITVTTAMEMGPQEPPQKKQRIGLTSTAMEMEDPNKDNPLLSLAPETHFKIIGHRLDLSEEQVNILSKLGQQDGLNTLTNAQWDVFKSLNFKGIKDISRLSKTCKGMDTLMGDIMKGLKNLFPAMINHLGSFGIELNDKMFLPQNKKKLELTIQTQGWKDFMVLLTQRWVGMYENAEGIETSLNYMNQNDLGSKNFKWLKQEQMRSNELFKNVLKKQAEEEINGRFSISEENLILPPIQLSIDKKLGKEILTLVISQNNLIIIPQEMVNNIQDPKDMVLNTNYLCNIPNLSHINVDYLNLADNPLTSDQIKNLPPSVKSLVLYKLSFDKIPQEIHTLRNLELLNLMHTNITTIFQEDGTCWLEELIKKNQNLNNIRLADNSLNEESQKKLAELNTYYQNERQYFCISYN